MFDAQKHKENIMRVLDLTSEEADAVIAYDKAVDRGEKTEFDLTDEQKKQTRKYRQADRKPTVYNWQSKRERKPNATKGGLIEELFKFLNENCSFNVENCEITNKERQIAFSVGENRFELTLVQKRASKK